MSRSVRTAATATPTRTATGCAWADGHAASIMAPGRRRAPARLHMRTGSGTSRSSHASRKACVRLDSTRPRPTRSRTATGCGCTKRCSVPEPRPRQERDMTAETKDITGADPSRRKALKQIGAALTGAIAAPYVITARAAAEPLYVNTWGGVWEQAAAANLFAPFTKETGIEIKTVSPVSFAKLAAQKRTGVYEFDVTTLGGGDIVRANDAGLIEKIDDGVIDRSKLAPDQVFQNGVASHAFSTIIAWRKDRYPHGGPQNWADFWDLKRFPGSRCMQAYAARVLPLALLADGVPKDKLYPMDVNRAFAALERLKPNIRVWWTQGQQSQQLLRDGEVDAIAIWHSRTIGLIKQNQAVDFTWNQGEIDRAYWVVSKGTP